MKKLILKTVFQSAKTKHAKTILFLWLLMSALSANAQNDALWALNGVNNISTGGNIIARAAKTNPINGDVYVLGHYISSADLDPGPGVFNVTGATSNYIFLAKYNSANQFQWGISLGEAVNGSFGYGLEVESSGAVYITGNTISNTIDFDPGAGTAILGAGAYVAKYNTNGQYQWAFRIQNAVGYDLRIDPSGNHLYVTGDYRGTVDFDPSAAVTSLTSSAMPTFAIEDIFIAKYSTATGAFSWVRGFGNSNPDGARGVVTDALGNVYITGYYAGVVNFDPSGNAAPLPSYGNRDIFIAKYDQNGNYLWANGIGSTNNDETYDIDIDASSNVVVTGYFVGTVDFDLGPGFANLTTGGTNADIFIAKYNSNGGYVWAKNMAGTNNESGYGLKIDANDNVLVTGYFQGTVDFDPGASVANLVTAGVRDIFLGKYDANGNYVWAKRFGSTSTTINDDGWAVAVDQSNNAMVFATFGGSIDYDPNVGAAYFFAPSTFSNVLIGKYSAASGAYISASQIGSFYNAVLFTELGRKIAQDFSGNVYVTGTFDGIVDFDPSTAVHTLVSVGSNDAYIAKYSSSGAFIWAKRFGSNLEDRVNGIKIDANDDVIVTGSMAGIMDFDPGDGIFNLSSNGARDIYFAKFSGTNGDLIWAKSIGSTSDEEGFGLAVDNNNAIYITGYFVGTVDFDPGVGVANIAFSATRSHVYVAKYNSSGDYLWAKGIPCTGAAGSGGYGIEYDILSNAVVISGEFSGVGNFDFPNTVNLTAIGIQDIFLAKYDALNGNMVWSKNMGSGSGNCRGTGVVIQNAFSQANIYLTGTFRNTVDFDPGVPVQNLASGGQADVFIASYDATGNYRWAWGLGSTGSEVSDGAISINSSQVIFGGSFQGTVDFDPSAGTNLMASNGGGSDAFYYRVNYNGTPNSFKTFGGNQTDVINGLSVTGSGEVYTTGNFAGTTDFNNFAPAAVNLTAGSAADLFVAKYGTCVGPTAPSISATLSTMCSGSSTTISVITGSLNSAQNWHWFSGSCGGTPVGTGTSITVSPTANTTYFVRGQGGCAAPGTCANIAITVNALPTAAISPASVTICAGQSTTMTASGGASYAWSNSGGTSAAATFSPTTTTTYTVTVTAANGCTATSARLVTVNTSPTAALSPANISICNGQSTLLTASGGSSYSWSSGLGTGASKNVNPTNTTTYTITATGANGCTASATSTVSVNPLPSVSISPATTIACIGNGITLTASGGATYLWNNSGGNNAAATFFPTTTTVYTVTVTSANGCTATASRLIDLGSAPNVSINGPGGNGGNFTICEGASISFNATVNPNLPVNYTWSNSGGTNNTVTYSPTTTTTTYSVTATDANGCTSTNSALVNVNLAPAASISPASVTICLGQSATLTASGGNSYLWNGTLGSGATKTITPSSSTTYTVTVTGPNGCSATTSRLVTVNALPTAALSPTSATICSGQAQTLTASGGSSYTWSSGLGTGNSKTVSPTVNTTYTVTVTDANTCTATATATLTINTATAINTQPLSQTACTGSNVTFNVAAAGAGLSYVWRRGSTIVGTNNAILTLNTVTAGDAGNYTVEVIGTCGSVTSTVASLTIVSSASITQQPISVSACAGTNQILTVVGTGGNNTVYQWKKGTINVGLNNDSLFLNNLTASDAGSYSVQITGSCGNVTSNTVTLTVNTNPTLSTTSTAAVCANTNGTATATANGGSAPYSFVWNNAQNSAIISGLATGTYTVTATDNNGCSTTSSATVSNNSGTLSATASATSALCTTANGTAIAVITGGTAPFSTLWSNGANTTTLSNLGAGTYTVTVTDANGCFRTASTTVTTNSGNLVATVSPAAAICTAANGSATATNTGGNAPFSYTWSNGGNNSSITGLLGGTYTVTMTDANGCQSTASAVVQTTSGGLSLSANATQELCTSGNGTATVSTTGGTAPFSFLWNNGTTDVTANGLSAGTYSATVTDANGCVQTTTATVGTNAGTLNATTAITAATCLDADGAATATPANGMAPYNFVWNNGQTAATGNALVAGNYTVTITDAAGCITTANAIVTATSGNLSATVSAVNALCTSLTGTAIANVTGGTAPFSFIWNNTQTSSALSNLAPGTYTVTVTDAIGCVNTANTTVGSDAGNLSATAISTDVSSNGANNGSIDLTVSGGTAPITYVWSNAATTEDLNNLTAGTYTVTITDANGCNFVQNVTINQPPVAVALTENNWSANLFPNPADNQTMVDVTLGTVANVRILLVNSLGQIIQSVEYSDVMNVQHSLNVSELPAAVYMVKITAGAVQKVQRLVISRK